MDCLEQGALAILAGFEEYMLEVSQPLLQIWHRRTGQLALQQIATGHASRKLGLYRRQQVSCSKKGITRRAQEGGRPLAFASTSYIQQERVQKRDGVDALGHLGAVLKALPRPSKEAANNAKHLLAGAMSAAVSRTVVAPMERVKLEYIVRGSKSSVQKTVTKILAAEGLPGLWRGNIVNVMRTAPFKAVNFFAFDLYRKWFLRKSGKNELTNYERGLAGAAAGITATVLCFPMDTIRTRMVAHGGEAYKGVLHCATELVRREGVGSLYRGLPIAVIGMAPAGAVFYGVYDLLKSSFLRSPEGHRLLRERQIVKSFSPTAPQTELGAIRTLLYGALAGASSETATYPLEVVRRQLQLQSAHGVRVGMVGMFLKVLNEGGVKALFAGLLPSTFQVLPSAALSYYVYEVCKVVLDVD